MRLSALCVPHPLKWQNRFNRDGTNGTIRTPEIQTDMPDEIRGFEQGREVRYTQTFIFEGRHCAEELV
jgi:hypothetical protein